MVSSVPVPSIWFPFSSFPLYKLLFSLLSFMSCHLIWFLLLRTHGSALSMCTHSLLSPQVSGRPGLYNEVGCHRLSLCTWFLFIATTHTFVPSCLLFMSSFICTHTFALTLVLLEGRRVCNPGSHRDPFRLFYRFCFFTFSAGGSGRSLGTGTNEGAHLTW